MELVAVPEAYCCYGSLVQSRCSFNKCCDLYFSKKLNICYINWLLTMQNMYKQIILTLRSGSGTRWWL